MTVSGVRVYVSYTIMCIKWSVTSSLAGDGVCVRNLGGCVKWRGNRWMQKALRSPSCSLSVGELSTIFRGIIAETFE